MIQRKIVQQAAPTVATLPTNMHPVLQRVYAARNIKSVDELDYSLSRLLPAQKLKGIDVAIALLYQALKEQRRVLLIGDFDTDGATSCAVAIRILTKLGMRYIDYLVPDRFQYGYGLSPEIVDTARQRQPDLIITVDNGITSIAGVKHARQLGIDVLVTDHHLPGAVLPAATAIINPNQPGDLFPSKYLAGVGVIFNILIAFRAYLRSISWFDTKKIADVNLAQVLDLVALGTIADVVSLDYNNRIMVAQGLSRIRRRRACPGILALLECAHRDPAHIIASDLGFAVAPRLNAAGRLTDMSIGIECLLTDDAQRAKEIAARLNKLNMERCQIQQEMEMTALASPVLKKMTDYQALPAGLCLYDEGWHQGVVGILASRLKERYHRPVIIFAPDKNDSIKGSGRSTQQINLHDILAKIAMRNANLIEKFGGHAVAVGLTIRRDQLTLFQQLFTEEVMQQTDPERSSDAVFTDGALGTDELNLELASLIRAAGPWGAGFSEPLFNGQFTLLDYWVVGKRHLRLKLAIEDTIVPAILFNHIDNEQMEKGMIVDAAYRLDINKFQGRQSLQLILELCQPTIN